MVFEYYVAVSPTGHADLAATKRSAVESVVSDHGGQLIAVQAHHAYEACRQAEALVISLH